MLIWLTYLDLWIHEAHFLVAETKEKLDDGCRDKQLREMTEECDGVNGKGESLWAWSFICGKIWITN